MFKEICRQFGLTQQDRELMDWLWSEWKPDYSLDDVVALSERLAHLPCLPVQLPHRRGHP